jgi:Flp pilus assembly pilin Flp
VSTPKIIGLRLTARLQGLSLERPREEGQTLAEYAIIVSLIAVVLVGVVALVGTPISSMFSNAAHKI